MKHGFTLIEISIVLVIIGLLIGGVLSGKDLITAAKLRASLSQLEKFNAATNAFKAKYNCLPGDCPNASSFNLGVASGLGDNGDGDGIVFSYRYWDVSDFTAEQTEIFNFWYHLGKAHLTPEFTGASPAGMPAIPIDLLGYMPLIPYGSSPTFVVATTPEDPITNTTLGGYYVLTSFNTPLATIPGTSIFGDTLTALEAWSIDSKLDDGIPATGNVKAFYPSVGPYWSTGPGQSCDNAGAGYDIKGIRFTGGVDSPARPDRIDCGVMIRATW